MKRNLISIMATGLALLPFASANAFETAQGVVATPILAVPFTITVSGNYYLPANLTFATNGATAITVNASEVYIDLNGRTLAGSGTNQVGILVNGRDDVTIQNGDIDGFSIGIFFFQTAKCTASNLRLNFDQAGVFSESSTSNWVKDSIIDGGAIGVYLSDDLGTRAENNILENQVKEQSQPFFGGIALVSTPSRGNVFDLNVVANAASGSANIGQLMTGTDKFRFESFTNFPKLSPFVGGTNEGAGSK
jgi:Periplasmic copper-binding protein (NosD)